MTRAHFSRPVQDRRGDLKGPLSVRLLEPGTTNPIVDPVYSSGTAPDTYGNPWSTDSIVDFYLDQPKVVRIGVASGTDPETYFEDVSVGTVGLAEVVPTNGARAVGQGEMVFRVTDSPFNAVPDGVTNCSTAINAASLAAYNAGNTGYAFGEAVVEFPYTPAGYAVTNLMTIQSGVTYRGDRHVKIKRVSTLNGQYIFNAQPVTDVTFENLTLDTNSKITSGAILCGTRTTVRNCWFVDSGLQYAACYPINFGSGTVPVAEVLISGCRFVNMRNNVHIRGNTQRVTVEDCDFTGFSSTAIAVDGDTTTCSKDVIIRGNRCHDHNSTTRPISQKQVSANVATVTIPTHVYTVTNKARAGNVATLDIGAHTYTAGSWIHVDLTGGDDSFDGYFLISAVGATTVSYAQVGPDVASIAATGSTAYFVLGETIYVDVGDTVYDGNHTLSDVTPTTVSWAKTSANAGPTASAGYVSLGNRQPISVQSAALDETQYHERITITGNQVLGNYIGHQATANAGTADCISMHHTKGAVISDNIVEGSGDCGIVMSLRTWRGSITGNTVIGVNGCGIAIGAQDAAAYVRILSIVGNTVLNSGFSNVSPGHWAATGINLRHLTGGVVEGNMLGDDQTVPTQQFGISVGDSVGTSTDVHIGPNQYVGNSVSKRLTPSGNVRLTFADQPITVTKTADTVCNMDGTAKNDPHLVAPLEANAVYEIEGVLGYFTNQIAGNTPGIKIGFAALAGASLVLAHDGPGTTSTGAVTVTSSSNRAFQTSFVSTMAAGGTTGATPARIIFKVRVTVGTTAGNFQLTDAQQTADAVNAATVMNGSYMTYKRVA